MIRTKVIIVSLVTYTYHKADVTSSYLARIIVSLIRDQCSAWIYATVISGYESQVTIHSFNSVLLEAFSDMESEPDL